MNTAKKSWITPPSSTVQFDLHACPVWDRLGCCWSCGVWVPAAPRCPVNPVWLPVSSWKAYGTGGGCAWRTRCSRRSWWWGESSTDRNGCRTRETYKKRTRNVKMKSKKLIKLLKKTTTHVLSQIVEKMASLWKRTSSEAGNPQCQGGFSSGSTGKASGSAVSMTTTSSFASLWRTAMHTEREQQLRIRK